MKLFKRKKPKEELKTSFSELMTALVNMKLDEMRKEDKGK